MKEIKDALILSASKGRRMAPLSGYIPKPLLPIYNEPLIVRHLNTLRDAGIKNVWITLEPVLGNMIEKAITTGYKNDLKIKFRYQDIIGGIGYATLLFETELKSDFIVILGDEYLTSNKFLEKVKDINSDVTIGICRYEDESKICSGCNVLIDKKTKNVKRLIEKPTLEQIVGPWCWTGYAKYKPNIFPIIRGLWKSTPEGEELDLTRVMQKAIDAGLVVKYIIEPGININITTVDDFAEAFCQEIKQRKGL